VTQHEFLFAEHAVILVVMVSFDYPDFILARTFRAYYAISVLEFTAAPFGVLDARVRGLEGKLNIRLCYSDSRCCSWLWCNLLGVQFGYYLTDIVYKIVPFHQGSHFQKHREISDLILVGFLRVKSLSQFNFDRLILKSALFVVNIGRGGCVLKLKANEFDVKVEMVCDFVLVAFRLELV
jgi:hypothetical protein